MEFELQMPQSLENMQLPAPELLTYYQEREQRCFWVDFDVDESLLQIGKAILQINRDDKDITVEERKPIRIYIFTNGGEMDACFSLIDLMLMSETPIVTINAGNALSAGLLLFIAGKERIALPHSRGLIHSGSASGIQGTFEQTEATMKDYKRMVKMMRDFILERTGIDTATLGRNKSKDWYLDANEMLKYGVATKIAKTMREVL